MLSKEEIENNKVPKQIAKVLEIKKEDTDSLITFKESTYEKTAKENIELKKKVEQLETDKQKLIEELEEDIKITKEQYSENTLLNIRVDGKIDTLEEILKILKRENNE